MQWMKSGLVAAVVMTGAACGATTQQSASTVARGASCSQVENLDQQVAQVYDVARVKNAKPIYTQRFVARAIQPRELTGAELYIDAQPGVSQPYLERVLSCHAAGSSVAHPNDPLRASNVRDVDVRVQGSQFVVAVHGADKQSGREIWKKAKALLQGGGNVEVQQLSAANTSAQF